MFIEITSNLIILYTVQYIVSYMIIDIIEQKRFEKMLKKYQDKPDRTIYAEFNIMDSFYDIPDNDKKYLCDSTYEKIDKPTLKKNKLSDSLGKIGFVIIDDYHWHKLGSSLHTLFIILEIVSILPSITCIK